MSNDQFNTILRILAQNGERIEEVYQELRKEIHKLSTLHDNLSAQMQIGFEKQLAISQLILDTVAESYQDHKATKKDHDARLKRLEARTFSL
ncbi:MAG TPA: hypothetical protein VN081_04220 [Dongiaceae bacterium]|nr:hypothetical protein [Dongiaceae bacterium]